MAERIESVEDYIGGFPPATQQVLEAARQAIHRAVPGAGETISYQIPTFTRDGRRFVHLAGWKKHISLYPVPDLDAELAARLAPYLSGQSTARFPLDRPIPYDLLEALALRLSTQQP